MYKRREYKVLHGDGDDSSSSDSESGEDKLQGERALCCGPRPRRPAAPLRGRLTQRRLR
jgi:hypothetical protein